MKVRSFLILCIFSFPIFLFSETETNDIEEFITETEIKIGKKINLTIKIPELQDVKVLWQDITISHTEAELISKKDSYKKNILNLDIIFTFFEKGNFDDFNFTIPISTSDGEMLYLETNKYNIFVESPLTDEEIENLKNIKDTSMIELKKEKPQAKISFILTPFVKIILFILIIAFIAMILYYFVYKKIMKKRIDEKEKKIPPFEKFMMELARVLFEVNDDRDIIEKKLSLLTEILKELIYNEFSFNAPAETTKELILSLKQSDFDQDLVGSLDNNLTQIDLIKFAKAPADFNKLKEYVDIVKQLGIDLHEYKKYLITEKENNENLQAG